MEKVIKISGSVLNDVFRKQFISSCVENFKQYHRDEYNASVQHAKEIRQSRANVFGAAGSKSGRVELDFRYVLTIPVRLGNMITSVLHSPDFIQEQWEYDWFKKTYPEFCAAEKY